MTESQQTTHRQDVTDVVERQCIGGGHAAIQPPLTPMIDVTFQLLLYFLLTTTFRPDEGEIPGSLMSPIPPVDEVSFPVRISLSPRGADGDLALYTIDNLPPIESRERFYETLVGRREAIGSDTIPVVIKPYGTVRWKYVVEAYNAAVYAKFHNVSLARAD